MRTPNSPAAAYLRGHHPTLALAVALAICGCTPGVETPSAAVKATMPEAPEELALGIELKVAEMLGDAPCSCEFFLDAGLTIQHLSDALAATEAELFAHAQAHPRAGVAAPGKKDIMSVLLQTLLSGESPKEAAGRLLAAMPEVLGLDSEAKIIARQKVIVAAMYTLSGARTCLLRNAERADAFAKVEQLLAESENDVESEETPTEPPPAQGDEASA